MTVRAIVLVLSLAPVGAAAPGPEQASLTIYLPRNASVQADLIRLGAISVVRGADEAMVKKAEAVLLGRSPWPKEQIVLDRRTILSRLGSCGIRAGEVRMTGAAKVAVTGRQQVISPERIVACAQTHLKSHPPRPPGCRWRPVRLPKEMVLAAAQAAELTAETAQDAPPHHVKVRVAATCGGREVAAAEVLFRLAYPARRAVATRQVQPGDTITPENIKVETVTAPDPQPEWTPPYGMVATARIPAGTVVRPGLVRWPKQPVAVRRNRSIIMKIELPGFSVTALGLALQDGRVGEFIKVRNMDSKRVVVAKVAADGTVEPVFKGNTK